MRRMLLVETLVVVCGIALTIACRRPPNIRFAPAATDAQIVRSNYPLTAHEREQLTVDNFKALTQAQVDQIYWRLSPGEIPDGPFRGDLFLPRGAHRVKLVRDVVPTPSARLENIADMPIEQLAKALWKGKVFFSSEAILRNRIEDLAILKPLIPNSNSIPKMSFDGQTTWLLFPAKVSCGPSVLEPAHHSILIDYSKGPEINGYREIPDSIAGPGALDIHDEVRLVRPGFYVGRAYFRGQFGLNFTLTDPAAAPGAAMSNVDADCVAGAEVKQEGRP